MERIRWFNQVVEGIWKNRKVGNKIKKKFCDKRGKLVAF
jgi:hypothetical protein